MTDVEAERRRRIRLSLAAVQYEFYPEDQSFMSDEEYDRQSKLVDLSIKTGRLDKFFQENFDPSTGMWVHKHPELNKLKGRYEWCRSYRDAQGYL